NDGRGAQLYKAPQYPFIYFKIGEPIETGTVNHESIHIRAIWRARRQPLRTTHFALRIHMHYNTYMIIKRKRGHTS
ncbi:MAG TPA: hypothetical protein DDY92_06300, partial [Dialister sp.]|nr:hypothetical protein [Dialister sp.]